MSIIQATGRRKTSIAKIVLCQGKGEILINKKKLGDYFPSTLDQWCVISPLEILGDSVKNTFDIKVTVFGGGVTGQKEAVRLGISRALVEVDADNKPALKHEGFLTRDPRVVERKKPGLKKARKGRPFKKR